MKKPKLNLLMVILPLIALGLMACEPPEPTDPTVNPSNNKGESEAIDGEAIDSEAIENEATEHELIELPAQAKPSAPVTVEYEVVGTPAVGEPTEIELSFASGEVDAAVSVSYRIENSAGLSFVEAPRDNMPVQMQRANGGSRGLHRLRIRPLSEGRQFLNVLTEIETEAGRLSKSTSIPIDVAAHGAQLQLQNKQVRETPGTEPQVDSAGEAVISMPAQEGER